MNRSSRLLAKALFRGDRLLRLATAAIVAASILGVLAANLSIAADRQNLELNSRLRFGGVSVERGDGSGLAADALAKAVGEIAAEMSLEFYPRLSGALWSGTAWSPFVAVLTSELRTWEEQGAGLRGASNNEWLIGLPDDRNGVVETPIPAAAIHGTLEDGTIVLDQEWLLDRHIPVTTLAASFAGSPFADAFELDQRLVDRLGSEMAVVRAWPEMLEGNRYLSAGASAGLLRRLVIGISVGAMAGVFAVAARGKTAPVASARLVGLSNTVVRRAFVREALRATLLGGLVAAGGATLAMIAGVVERHTDAIVSTVRTLPLFLLSVTIVATLVAWRLLGIRLQTLRGEAK